MSNFSRKYKIQSIKINNKYQIRIILKGKLKINLDGYILSRLGRGLGFLIGFLVIFDP